MLEQLRKSGASIAIYLIFGLLIVIFVINFAPNAGQGGGGCSGSRSVVLDVDGHKANQTAYKIAYSGNQYNGRQKVYVALEYLIRKELLAQAANERGIRVTGDLVDEEIKKGTFFLGGNRIPLTFWLDDIDGDKFFNYGKLKGWVNQLNVSIGSYKEEQARSMQAALMADVIKQSAMVSREEAKSNYLFENTTVSYDVVTFNPTAYRTAMRLTDADIARFITGHEAEVKKKYADEERTYKATKPALKLRSIFIAAVKPAATTPEKPADGAGSGSAAGSDAGAGSGSAVAGAGSAAATPPAPAKPEEKKIAGPTVDEAKAKLEAARTAIAAKKQTFADAAKQLSTDEATKANGGDQGWRSVENAQLGDKSVNDAVKALKPGELTPVIVTDAGVWLVTAEDKREGDLTFDQVKAEIAVEMAKDTWSQEAAKRAALAALETARAGTGKNLDQMFERSIDMEKERRKIQEQIQQQIQQQMNQKQGFLDRLDREDSDLDVPAAWRADEPAPSGGSAAPAAGSAAPAAGSAAPAAGSAVPAAGGSAAPAAGSGAGAGSATTTTTTPTPAPVASADLVASTETLPTFGDMPKPKVITEGPTPRQKELPGVGDSKDAIAALFDELSTGMLGKKVYESKGTYVIVQLKDKAAPKVEEFDKLADKEIAQLRELRGTLLLEGWLKARCEALAKDGKISPMADLIRETDDAGKPLPQVYRPCMMFR